MTNRFTCTLLSLILTFMVASFVCNDAKANTYNVANGDIAGLIAAVSAANTNPGPDIINLAPGGTYSFTSPGAISSWWGDAALPEIYSEVTINGNGATL